MAWDAFLKLTKVQVPLSDLNSSKNINITFFLLDWRGGMFLKDAQRCHVSRCTEESTIVLFHRKVIKYTAVMWTLMETLDHQHKSKGPLFIDSSKLKYCCPIMEILFSYNGWWSFMCDMTVYVFQNISSKSIIGISLDTWMSFPVHIQPGFTQSLCDWGNDAQKSGDYIEKHYFQVKNETNTCQPLVMSESPCCSYTLNFI